MNPINYDSKFTYYGGKLADLLILNFLTVICSLPLFTLGASVTAMHYVLFKMLRDEDDGVARCFFRSFRENFRQATQIWLVCLLILCVLVLDYYWMHHFPELVPVLVRYLLPVAVIFSLVGIAWLFPILSHYRNTVRNTVRNAILMSLNHPLYTLMMMVLIVAPGAVFLQGKYLMLVGLLFGMVGPAILRAMLYSKIFEELDGEV